MKSVIKVVNGIFTLDNKTFEKISANYFGINDKIVIYRNDRKTMEYKVKYEQKTTTGNAYFQETFPGEETKKELLPSQFNDGDEIYFPDPDELFIKIIGKEMLIS